MRAGPLSDDKVIALLNRAFVCVYAVNEDYREKGSAPAEEKAELRRIQQEGYKKKLSVGTVHAYVLTPDGRTHDSLHVAEAAKSAKTLDMLKRAVTTFKPKEGQAVAAPMPQSKPPKTTAGDLVLHLVSRGDDRGSWGEFPGENWIVLGKAEWSKLLPKGAVKAGVAWNLDAEVSQRILTYFYPQTENNAAPPSRIEKHSLRATVLSVKGKGGVVQARLDGNVRMMHVFYPGRKNAEPIEATLLGVLTFEPGKTKPPALQLVTTEAVHGKRKFSVAVRPATAGHQP